MTSDGADSPGAQTSPDAHERDLACQEFVTLITGYLDGALSADTASLVEAHLAECPGCEQYLAQMRTTIATLGQLPVQSLSRDIRDTILTAFRDFPRPERRPG